MKYNFLTVLKVMGEYNNKPHAHGQYDCNRMLLSALGHDVNNLPEYNTPIRGRTALRKYLQVKNMGQYLEQVGFQKISPVLISDFDVIISGVNCSIYLDGKMFGVRGGTNEFGLIPYQLNNNFEVYRWLSQ
ncbi:hypothetical protein [Edwardsiella tarda]|uniref:hypothetical protein n=1 Tax=Edwardsiella tarda TaxID=636 RepID=UPI00083A08C7|nr:hypothetical protein [Edwardsiella tarda]